MVGTLVRLQLTLFWRQLKSNVSVLVLNIIFAAGLLGFVIAACYGLTQLRGGSTNLLGGLTVTVFAALTLAWPIVTVLFTGTNEMLDIGRFALFPVRPNKLIPGLLLCGLLGMGGIAMMIVCLGWIVAWSSGALTVIGALLGSVLGLALLVLASRTLTTGMSGVMRKRKARDFMMVGVFLLVMAVSIGANLFSQMAAHGASLLSMSELSDTAQRYASIVSYTPFGWAWGIPWSLAQSHWLIAAGQLVGSAAIVAVLWMVWSRQVSRGLTSPLETAAAGEKIRGTAFYDKYIPYGAPGAIARRTIRYYRRDPRRMMNAIALFIMPIVMGVVAFTIPKSGPEGMSAAGFATFLAYASVSFSWMIGMVVAAELCWDGSAIGTQIISGVGGRDDRRGRALSMLVIFGPIQLVICIVMFAIGGGWGNIPGVIGVLGVLLLGGIGIGNLVGSFWQYAQPPAGGNVFAKGASGGAAGFASVMISMFAPLIASVPVVGLLVGSIWLPWLQWVALPVGLLIGWALYQWGIRTGGDHLDRIWPEVLDRVTWKN
jgi:ABC-2 type transport system permease protein